MRPIPLAFAAVLAAALTTGPADAARYMFNLSGSRTANFSLESTAPAFFSDFQSQFQNVPGVFDGMPGVASAVSFGVVPLISSVDIINMTLGFSQFAGPQLFTGPTSNPVFKIGTFTLTGIVSGNSTLTIAAAAVPEPAAWTLLIAGFGLVGAALRRRQACTTA